jgi:hypothetical protein
MKPGEVVVIGLDGFDPTLTEGMIERGELPNLGKLRRDDGYCRFATVRERLRGLGYLG